MTSSRDPRSLGDLLSDLVHQFQRLIQTEYRIARVEIGDSMSRMRAGGAFLLIGAILLLPALTIFLWGVSLALTRTGLPPDLAALAVGVVTCVIGLAVLLAGISRIRAVKLVPEKAIEHLQRDVAVLNQTRSDHEHAAA